MLLVSGLDLAQATPVTIGFDGLSPGVFPSPYIEDGFSSSRFAGGGGLFIEHFLSTGNPFPDIVPDPDIGGTLQIVSTAPGERFTFVGLDLAEFDRVERGLNNTTVEGWLNGGFVGMGTFTPNQDESYRSAMAMGALSGTILDEVRINIGFTFLGAGAEQSSYGRVDNIVLDKMIAPQPIPEPGTMLLMGTGLAGLVAWRRKKAI